MITSFRIEDGRKIELVSVEGNSIENSVYTILVNGQEKRLRYHMWQRVLSMSVNGEDKWVAAYKAKHGYAAYERFLFKYKRNPGKEDIKNQKEVKNEQGKLF